MKPKERERAEALETSLAKLSVDGRPLLGIRDATARQTLILQVIDSLRRVEYAHFIRDSKISLERMDPSSSVFDPLRAAVLRMRRGEYDEAFWLVFLFVHFGKHSVDGWRLVRDIYGGLGENHWSWRKVSTNPRAFRDWLVENQDRLVRDGVSRRFGNHRKYETLSASSSAGTAAVVDSYVTWVSPPRTHRELIQEAHRQVGQDPRAVFDFLYRSMNAVSRFGRLAKFDYLTMLGKLGIAPIEPGSAYLVGATGPMKGARLLFLGSTTGKGKATELDLWLNELDQKLGVGMQVLEDSLCNWQKSPRKYVHFRG